MYSVKYFFLTNISVFRAGTRMRSRQKSANVASVKPIKASDEKTLESAIAMAHSLASKSMHDLDKRCRGEIFDPVSPNRSAHLLNSILLPLKKTRSSIVKIWFSFKRFVSFLRFPGTTAPSAANLTLSL